ncbi:class I SAM-dependent methyltransferase [Paenarthrobacter histidinolovorans]|uniref:class I SAM-dependent methyltransferase n=1 Tax=Paenarthrobacter histidinolovorans TaxID=43664 RepID=UPI001667CCD9|nr:class I SAM-dependent methyltransferase [Paenarthrobacter histidinolovorans]GGJ38854.1 methyltransferase [Paenarthrobacter histidinolovorans]
MSSGISAAYSSRAAEYTSLFGSISSTHTDDRALVQDWAGSLDGKIIDAGCGPGQWTHFLHSLGLDAEGVDLVPEFIATGRKRYPDVRFTQGSLEQLPTPDQSLAGILAWYSVIHTPPGDIDEVLGEFARCLMPGGGILLGFFEGDAVEEFPHAVAPAYFWPLEEMSVRLQNAGLIVVSTHFRADPGVRPHAAIVARQAKP